VGFVFQEDRLLPWQTVLKNTALPLRHGERLRDAARPGAAHRDPAPLATASRGAAPRGTGRKSPIALAAALLEEFGLGTEGEKYPEELSGGMRKRAAFSRCFARAPGLILLDEPFSGLHREARGHLWEGFLRLLERHRVPVVIVTHYPEELTGAKLLIHYALEGRPARMVRREGRSR
jgi:ABC-type nitrate/sulfonate/bicarbonate transport system ATPase subunit